MAALASTGCPIVLMPQAGLTPPSAEESKLPVLPTAPPAFAKLLEILSGAPDLPAQPVCGDLADRENSLPVGGNSEIPVLPEIPPLPGNAALPASKVSSPAIDKPRLVEPRRLIPPSDGGAAQTTVVANPVLPQLWQAVGAFAASSSESGTQTEALPPNQTQPLPAYAPTVLVPQSSAARPEGPSVKPSEPARGAPLLKTASASHGLHMPTQFCPQNAPKSSPAPAVSFMPVASGPFAAPSPLPHDPSPPPPPSTSSAKSQPEPTWSAPLPQNPMPASAPAPAQPSVPQLNPPMAVPQAPPQLPKSPVPTAQPDPLTPTFAGPQNIAPAPNAIPIPAPDVEPDLPIELPTAVLLQLAHRSPAPLRPVEIRVLPETQEPPVRIAEASKNVATRLYKTVSIAPAHGPVLNPVDRVLALAQPAWPSHAIVPATDQPEPIDPLPPSTAPEAQVPSEDHTPEVAFTVHLDTRPDPPAPPVPPVSAATPVPPAVKVQRSRTEDDLEPEPRIEPGTIPTARLTTHAVEATVTPDRTALNPRAEAPKPAHPAEAVPPELPTAPKPAGAARDIKLQVAGAGPQRVEVHLSERAGQVQVAVHTPDSHLSDALREHLPTLTTRLAESGIRAETWHPSAPAEWQRNTETSHAGLVQDHNPQSGGQQQEQQSGGDARRPKAPEAPTQTKQKGKDFAWLMSTLQ